MRGLLPADARIHSCTFRPLWYHPLLLMHCRGHAIQRRQDLASGATPADHTCRECLDYAHNSGWEAPTTRLPAFPVNRRASSWWAACTPSGARATRAGCTDWTRAGAAWGGAAAPACSRAAALFVSTPQRHRPAHDTPPPPSSSPVMRTVPAVASWWRCYPGWGCPMAWPGARTGAHSTLWTGA